MSEPEWLNWLATVVLVTGLGYLLIVFARRVWLSRRGGLFDCGLRLAGTGRWRSGLARYSGERFEWYLLWRVWPRPSRVFVRGECEVNGLRETSSAEANLGYGFSTILSLHVTAAPPDRPQQNWELALSEGSAMGLVSWLESAPPGPGDYRRRHD